MKPISNEDFDDRLTRMVGAMTASQLLSYGEVYTVLAEELNNAILTEYESEQTKLQAEIDDLESEGPQPGDIITRDKSTWRELGDYGAIFLYGSTDQVLEKLKLCRRTSANLWLISNSDIPKLIPTIPA